MNGDAFSGSRAMKRQQEVLRRSMAQYVQEDVSSLSCLEMEVEY